MEEFEQHLLAGEWVSQGGMDFARGALGASRRSATGPVSLPRPRCILGKVPGLKNAREGAEMHRDCQMRREGARRRSEGAGRH